MREPADAPLRRRQLWPLAVLILLFLLLAFLVPPLASVALLFAAGLAAISVYWWRISR